MRTLDTSHVLCTLESSVEELNTLYNKQKDAMLMDPISKYCDDFSFPQNWCADLPQSL
jgi:hypothetical protein